MRAAKSSEECSGFVMIVSMMKNKFADASQNIMVLSSIDVFNALIVIGDVVKFELFE
ncbi:hypothetical protein D3C77_702050 [compost metagenome]